MLYNVYILLHLFILCPLSLKCRLFQNTAYCIPIDAKMEESQFPLCKGKLSSLLQCVSYHRHLLHFYTKLFVSDTSHHQRCRGSQNLGKVTYIFWFKIMTKDTGEQPDEEMHTVRSREGPQHQSLSPWSWGVCHFPVWMASPVWHSQKPLLLGFLWKLPHICVIND